MRASEFEVADKAGFWAYLRVVLVILINAFFAFGGAGRGLNGEVDAAYIFGFVVSNTFVFPLAIVLIFQLGKKSRNRKSRLKIFFWTSLILILSSITQLAQTPIGT
ncbi:MAG: hypothetical protein ACI87O_003085 [Planctomycetota bacterium]